MKMALENKNLLVISHSYNSFQKDHVDYLANNFKKAYVLVRYNPLANISKYTPLFGLSRFRLHNKIDETNVPSNVEIYPTPVLYAPINWQYRRLGVYHLKSVENIIRLNNIKFNLIHSHFTWSSGYVGARIKERYDIPLIITSHGYDIYDLPFRDTNWREKIEYVLNSADYIITVSKNNLKCLKELNVRTPVEVIPNGFRSDLFYPRKSDYCKKILGLPLEKKIILTIGNLEEVKGHKYLIESIQKIAKRRKDILCIIIGSGKLEGELNNLIGRFGLKNHIKLIGQIKHEEIPLWINSCDIFVLPSLNEGNPTVMFECLGCGKPFAGTKVGGIPEIITSEEYGILCERKDSTDLARIILYGIDINWDRHKIRAYAEQYTWDNLSKRILQIYEKVCC